MQIKSIRKLSYQTPVKVFDLSVEGVHNFTIGVSKIVSHNCAAYHHGEASLESTIVGLAQDHPGANNLNYLKPLGQFGSRLGNSPSASRYIFTDIATCFRKIFKRDDDLILKHLVEDGEEIEPERYLPILPNVLVNGAAGMGTGFACRILSYNPEDLRKYIIDKLKTGATKVKLIPWFRGFKGKVERMPSGQVQVTGVVVKETSTKLVVTELPIDMYQDSYKEILFGLQDAGFIKDFDNGSTVNGFRFELDVPRATGYAEEEELIGKLKLTTKITENFTVWLPSGKLKCFKTPEELCDAFIEYRLERYEDRRLAKIVELSEKLDVLNEKVRFIEMYLQDGMSGKISKMTKAKLEEMLTADGYKHVEQLLEIRIYNLTQDNIDIIVLKQLVEYFEQQTKQTLYLNDLTELDMKDDLKPPVQIVKVKKGK
jgi:DNA topoisomerase-2